MRQQRNRQLALSKQAGGTAGQAAQIARGAEQDIAATAWSQEQEALGEYQKTISNVLSGQSTLELMWGGLGAASMPQASGTSGGGGITVICTELHRQGKMSDEMYAATATYGIIIKEEDPSIYVGYRLWADPIVRLMKKSELLSKVVSVPTLAWGRLQQNEETVFGEILKFIGVPFCRVLGNWRLKWQSIRPQKV